MISTATRRVRNRSGSSYLTRGGDNHDHRGLNKARRALSSALIAEQLADDEHEEHEEHQEYLKCLEYMECHFECPDFDDDDEYDDYDDFNDLDDDFDDFE